MPIFRIHTPDGKILQVHAPEGTTQEQAIAFATGNVPQAESPSMLDQAKNLGLGLAQGGANLMAFPGKVMEATGIVPGPPAQMILGALTNRKGVQEFGKSWVDVAEEKKAQIASAQPEAVQQQLEAKGWNTSKLVEMFGEGLPSVAPFLLGGEALGGTALGFGAASAGLGLPEVFDRTFREKLAINGGDVEDARDTATVVAAKMLPVEVTFGALMIKGASAAMNRVSGPLSKTAAGAVGSTPAPVVQAGIEEAAAQKAIKPEEDVDLERVQTTMEGSAVSNLGMGLALGAKGGYDAALQQSVMRDIRTVPKPATKAEAPREVPAEVPVTPQSTEPVGTRIETFNTNKKAKNQLTGPMAGRIAAMEGLKPMPNKPGYFHVPEDKVADIRSILDPDAPIETPTERLEAKLKAREDTRQKATAEEIVPPEEVVEAPEEVLPEPGEEVVQQKLAAVKTGQRLTAAKAAKKAEREQLEEDTRLAQQDTPLATEPIDFQHRIAPNVKNPPLARSVAEKASEVLGRFKVKLEPHIFEDFNDPKQVPPEVQAKAKAEGRDDPPAFRVGNKIYINSNKIKNARGVVKEVLHESYHIGEELYHADDPAGLAEIHNEIFNSKRADVRRLIAESKTDPNTPEGKRRIGSEVLARLKEKDPSFYLVRKAVHKIRKWINKILGGKYATFNNLSDNDLIVRFIAPVDKFLKTGVKNTKFDGVSEADLKAKLGTALIESRANPADRNAQRKIAEIESELEARHGQAKENTIDFQGRQSNKELFAIRRQVESELKDPHLTEEQITNLDKHLAEIDRDIHDNNIRHMKTMIKNKKPLSEQGTDFQHELTDYKQMDNDKLKRVYLNLLKRGVDRINEPDYNDIVDETIKVGQALYDRGIDTTKLPKYPDVDDLGEALPLDTTTLGEADAEVFAKAVAEAKEPTPKPPKAEDVKSYRKIAKDITWDDLSPDYLVRSKRYVQESMADMDKNSPEHEQAIKDLIGINEALGKKQETKLLPKEMAPAEDKNIVPAKEAANEPKIDFQHELETHESKDPNPFSKSYDWVIDNVRSASDLLKKGEGRVNELGRAIKNLVVFAQTNRGRIQKFMTPATNKIENSNNRQEIITQFGDWVRTTQAGDTFDVGSMDPVAKNLTEAVRQALDSIGAKMESLGMMATNPKTGKKVPFKMRKDFVPAILLPKIRLILTNRGEHRQEFNEIAQKMIDEGYTHKGKKIETLEDANNYINQVFTEGNFESGFFGDMGMTSKLPFPLEFYDHSLDAVRKYMDRASERLAQEEAMKTVDVDGKPADLFDETLAEIKEKSGEKDAMYAYVSSLRKLVYNDRFLKTEAERSLQILNTLATGLQLAGPKSVGINFLGGMTNIIGFSDLSTALKAFKALADTDAVFAAEELANNIGATSDDALKLQSDNEAMGMSKYAAANKVSRLVSDATTHLMGLKRFGPLKHFSFNSSENKVRVTSLFAAKFQLDMWKEAYLNNALSARSKVFEKYARDEGIDFQKLMEEEGWQNIRVAMDETQNPESVRFYQTYVNRLQGSYRLDQVPRWLDTWYGRFLFKYNKYGFQVARMADKQIVEYIRDPSTRAEGIQNMVKYISLYSTMGVLTAQIIKNLFGDDKLPSEEEFKKVFDDKAKEKNFGEWLYLLKNVLNSMHVLGALGPISIANQKYDQFKQFGENPLSAPGLAVLDNTSKLIGKWLWSSPGTFTSDPVELGKDAAKFLASNISLIGQSSQALGTATERVPRLRAGRTLNKTRQAIQRYINATGAIEQKSSEKNWLPIVPNLLKGSNVNKVLKDKINTALMVNNPDAAEDTFKQELKRLKARGGTEGEADDLKNAISSSVLARRPFAVYGKPGGQVATEMFKDWAEAHLPAKDYAEMKALDDSYMRAAFKAGLISRKRIQESSGVKALRKYERSQRPMRGQ